MWIAFPSPNVSVNDPPRSGIERFSPMTVAATSPAHGMEKELLALAFPADPAKRYRSPRYAFSIARVVGLYAQPETTEAPLSAGASDLICAFSDVTPARTAA
jgi:hypothetical protein